MLNTQIETVIIPCGRANRPRHILRGIPGGMTIHMIMSPDIRRIILDTVITMIMHRDIETPREDHRDIMRIRMGLGIETPTPGDTEIR
jgi:hypothetical protein